MLVGTLEVDVSRVLELGTVLADGLPGHAGVPPHVEDVAVGLEVMAAALGADAGIAEVGLGCVGEPGVGTLLVEQCDDGVERVVVHDLLAAVGAGEGRNRNAPVALAGDAPVGTLLDHGADTVDGVLGVPGDVVAHLVERLLAQTGLVHGDEPLVRRAEEHRVLAAPAVRVAMGDLHLGHEHAAVAQELDDVRIGLVGVHAGERAAGAELLAVVEAAVVVDGHADVHALLHADVVVVDAVAGRVVDDTGTVLGAHVVGQQRHALDPVEDGLLVVQVVEDLGGDLVRLAIDHHGRNVPAGDAAHLLGEVLEHDLGAAVVLDGGIDGLGLERDRLVGRDGPGGGGPDHEVHGAVKGLEAGRLARELEAHVDGRARLVAVLDFGLGQRRVAVLAPVHGLMAAIDHAAIEHGLEGLNVSRVVLMVEREVRVIPVAQDAQALEALALQVDVLDGKLVAQLANLRDARLVELLRAEFLLDLVLDGLAVAVPTGDVGGLIALHRLVAVDHVFGDLVHRVAQVDGTVGIRRTVVQHELLVALVLLEHELVDVVLLPALQAIRLALRQGRPHGELGLGQVHGLLVLVCHEYPLLVMDA